MTTMSGLASNSYAYGFQIDKLQPLRSPLHKFVADVSRLFSFVFFVSTAAAAAARVGLPFE